MEEGGRGGRREGMGKGKRKEREERKRRGRKGSVKHCQ